MKVFLSSTFLDLVEERQAVLKALHRRQTTTLAMEYFLAVPRAPLDTALSNLRQSDVLLLVIGFKAGSLLPDEIGSTYTSAEYDEALKLGRDILVFVKQEKSGGSQLPSWRNAEEDEQKQKALEHFKARACERSTPDYFASPDGLALAVIQALDAWGARGRPGARKTFASTDEYFAAKNPVGQVRLLDFSTTLLGRDQEIRELNAFAKEDGKRVCILSGRGGIGKSKVLHDWAKADPACAVFLKDEPTWSSDSEKEIPIDCKVVVVDDAHRQESFAKVLQLLEDTADYRKLKLLVSTPPGSTRRLIQQIQWRIDTAQVLQLPELRELSREQSRSLAEEVLGSEFSHFAPHLSEIASNSPLVIVAGGRLIASRKISPTTLTTLDEFRSTIFNRLLEEMDLTGSRFAINPRRVLDLIAALGPVDVESRDFQDSAEVFFKSSIDDILKTVDELAVTGLVTARPRPVRVIPDVLSDYLLEAKCTGPGGSGSTRYAEKVYERFGRYSLKSLMRNLAELDWRLGQSGETGLSLLRDIWSDIHQRFKAGDEYERHRILNELSPGAIYQPNQVIALIRAAIDDPIQIASNERGSFYRVGQNYVLSALPDLLEATAYHPERLRESIDILWQLSQQPTGDAAESAKTVLKRLASWRRFGNAAMNFSMLVEAIRLTYKPDAYKGDFTPFELIRQILEREGEFTEWNDELSVSFGGFGLNYSTVGPVRNSALDYLEFALEGDGQGALNAVSLMERLLHNHLNRIGRPSSEQEREWHNQERQRCLAALANRYTRTASILLERQLHSALRSATSIYCPQPIRDAAREVLSRTNLRDEVAVIDAICSSENDLPLLTTEFSAEDWERPILYVMKKGRSSLERLISDTGNQARFIVDQTHACLEVRVKAGGFHRFMLEFADRPDFLGEVADQLINHEAIDDLLNQLSAVMFSMHVADPESFRTRALLALKTGALQVIHACAHNLRVFENATSADVAVIQQYGAYPDPVAKRGAIFAITYMGKFIELRESLKEAVLSIHADGDKGVAADLGDAFGPYGLPLTCLSRDEAMKVALEFRLVEDWDFDQGAIPRFLNNFVNLFPDETYDLLLQRIQLRRDPQQPRRYAFRVSGLAHGNISFGSVPIEKRIQLGRDCLARLISSESPEDFAELFWDVTGYDTDVLNLILGVAPGLDDRGARSLSVLIGHAIPKLAFTDPDFVKALLSNFSGEQRALLVEAFDSQARYSAGGGFYAGSLDKHMAEERQGFASAVASFPDDAGLEDLARALRRGT